MPKVLKKLIRNYILNTKIRKAFPPVPGDQGLSRLLSQPSATQSAHLTTRGVRDWVDSVKSLLLATLVGMAMVGCGEAPEPKPKGEGISPSPDANFAFQPDLSKGGAPESLSKPEESSLSSDAGLSKGAALVLTLEGEVRVANSSGVKGTAATVNQFLSPGDSLETGRASNALLLLTNGTTLSVGANTTFVLKAFYQEDFSAGKAKVGSLAEEASSSTVLIDLKVGDLVVDVRTLKKKSNFEITSPLGVAGIRGTSFGLSVSSNTTKLSVLTGLVDFLSNDDKQNQVGAEKVLVLSTGKEAVTNDLAEAQKQSIAHTVAKAKKESEGISLSILGDKVGSSFKTHLVPSAGNLEMIWVEPDTFMMGSPRGEKGREGNELQHQVTLSRGFYLGKYEVTQAQWARVMGNQPSKFKGTNRPVERVSWYAATKFCKRLTDMERETGRLPPYFAYQLPTESEWEYACRAGTTTAYSWGNGINSSRANYNYGNDPNRPVKVGQFAANPWGFHDMHGNVMEWVSDWSDSYPEERVLDPMGPATGQRRIKRGGCWGNKANALRSAWRGSEPPGSGQKVDLGFRVALKAIQE